MSRQWLEKELEEYTCTHLEEFWEAIYDRAYGEPEYRLLGRQIPTSAGIIDALVICEGDLFIVEFKAVKATQKDVGQLQRYRNVFTHIPAEALLEEHNLSLDIHQNVVSRYDESVKLVLIAPDFTKEAQLGADLCVQATFEDEWFYYKEISGFGGYLGKNQHLYGLVAEYLKVLVDAERAQMLAMEAYVLTRHAERSAEYTN